MATRRLDRLGLDAQLVARLLGANIMTVKDLLETNLLALMAAGDLSPQAAQQLSSVVSAKVLRDDIPTALELHSRLSTDGACLRTGIAHFDTFLGGGLPVGTLTELVGPRASARRSSSCAASYRRCLVLWSVHCSSSSSLPTALGLLLGRASCFSTRS